MNSDQTPKPQRCQPGVYKDRRPKKLVLIKLSEHRTKFWPTWFRIPTHLKPLADDTPAAENNFIVRQIRLPIQPGKSPSDRPIETLIDWSFRAPIVSGKEI